MDAEGGKRSSSPLVEDAMALVLSIDDFEGPFEPIPKGSDEGHVSPPPDPLPSSLHFHTVKSPGHPGIEASAADVDDAHIDDSDSRKKHAYADVGIIQPGTYTRALLRGTPRRKGRKLQMKGCSAIEDVDPGSQKNSTINMHENKKSKRGRHVRFLD